MDRLNNLKYCEGSTKAHPLSKAYPKNLQTINNILLKEGARVTSFDDEVALNLDDVEEFKASSEKRAKRKTVDLTFCIKNQKEKKSKPQAILTELKLKLKSKNNVNIEEKDLTNKIENSIVLLTREVQIHHKYLLIVNDTLQPQMENRLKRKLSNNPKFTVLSINEFHNTYFS